MSFTRQTAVMEDKLKDQDTVDDPIEQLKKLDKYNNGKLPTPELKQYMLNMDGEISSEEVEE